MVIPSKKELLQSHPLFESLSWWQFRDIVQKARIIEFSKGEEIIEEGKPGDSFYIVMSGRCEAFSTSNGSKHVYNHYLHGDSFGETALLSEENNWCSVKALNDSLLIKIHKDDFEDLIENNANISHQLSQRIARRIHQRRTEQEKAKWGKIISIGSAIEEIGKTLFGVNTAAALENETGESICVVDFSRQPGGEEILKMPSDPNKLSGWVEESSYKHSTGISIIPAKLPKETNKDVIGPFLGAFMTEYDYLFVILPEGLSAVVQEIYEQSDQIYILTNLDNQTLYQSRLLLNQLDDDEDQDSTKIEVILSRLTSKQMKMSTGVESKLHHSVAYRIPEISKELTLDPLADVPLVFDNPNLAFSKNIRRIARQIGGVSIGLALGAGAARGLSHIGVIRMLEEEDIVIDVVAGTSIGALVGAQWALGSDTDRMENLAHEFKKQGGLWKLTDLSFPPTKSILRSGRIEEFLNYLFEDATFSDTQFPLEVITADLDELEEVVISEGSIRNAVRASISIPILFAPIIKNGQYFVDGGVINPIPIEPLSNYGVGKIIAVNPIPPIEILRENQHLTHRAHQQENWWTWLKKQVLPFGSGNIMDTFMRSLQAMQSRLADSASAGADVVINPYVASAGWYEFNKVDTFIKQGELTARQHLEEIKELISSE